MAKIAVYLTRPQISALMNAATAMLAGKEGEGDFLCRADVLDRAAVALARADAGNQVDDDWIPVSERLPELTQFADSNTTGFSDSVLVLVTADDEPGDKYYEVAQYHYSGNPNLRSGWLGDSGAIMDTVTHWQPLPEAPESEAAE